MSVDGLIREAQAQSPLGASDGEWHSVWRAFIAHCGQQLMRGKGITVPNFVTFSCSYSADNPTAKPLLWFHTAFTHEARVQPRTGCLMSRPLQAASPPLVNWLTVAGIAGVSKHIAADIMKSIISALILAAAAGRPIRIDMGFCRIDIAGGRYDVLFAEEAFCVPSGTVARPVGHPVTRTSAFASSVAPGAASQRDAAHRLPTLSSARGGAVRSAGGSRGSGGFDGTGPPLEVGGSGIDLGGGYTFNGATDGLHGSTPPTPPRSIAGSQRSQRSLRSQRSGFAMY
eukprot:TRINITY_DN12025_c0_g1_i1.p1 TRINITY_DN12025_c0_g1~~TRINITY_DN12025_c0_g1_i1.p1  ORF type:complete len:285 (+),score=28.38 TRINITY_DN12025_c0_g1_i1:122-976(+)